MHSTYFQCKFFVHLLQSRAAVERFDDWRMQQQVRRLDEHNVFFCNRETKFAKNFWQLQVPPWIQNSFTKTFQ